MSDTKKEMQSNNIAKETKKDNSNLLRNLNKLDHDYLVIKNFIAVSFFIIAFFIMTPVAFSSDLFKIFLVIFGLIIILFCKALILEFIVKTLRLQSDLKINRYSAIVSINSFFGLAIPVFYINIILYQVIAKYLYWITDYGTMICKVRKWFAEFLYSELDIYTKLDNLAFILIVFTFALFLFGGAFERTMNLKKK